MNLSRSGLAFMHTNRYIHSHGLECDYSNLPRPFFTIATILRGEADFEQNEVRFHVSTGDALFIPFRTCYRSRWNGNPSTELISCHFQLPSSSPPVRDRFFRIQKLTDDGFISNTLQELQQTQEDESAFFAVLARFYALCDHVFNRLEYQQAPSLSLRMQKAVSYIESHYRDPFSVKELAEYCHMSESHLYSCFRSELGVSPITYKHRAAITAAEQLLTANEDLSIEAISDLTGFETSTYFRRVFKSMTGCSPRAYRQQQTGL